jgi:hypothetical protein
VLDLLLRTWSAEIDNRASVAAKERSGQTRTNNKMGVRVADLLLGVLLHLVGLIFVARLAVLRVVATVVHQSPLGCEEHDVGAHVVEKVLVQSECLNVRVRDETGDGEASEQQAAVCKGTPGSGTR